MWATANASPQPTPQRRAGPRGDLLAPGSGDTVKARLAVGPCSSLTRRRGFDGPPTQRRQEARARPLSLCRSPRPTPSVSTPARLLLQVLRAPAPRSALTRAGGTEPTPRHTVEVTTARPSLPAPPAPGTGPEFCATLVHSSHLVYPSSLLSPAPSCLTR